MTSNTSSFCYILYMSILHEKLWTAFNGISFEETKHKYTDERRTDYQSATGWYKQFVPEEDWDLKAYNAAIRELKKEGVATEIDAEKMTDDEIREIKDVLAKRYAAVQARWKYAGDYACALGTQIHSVMENLWYKKDYHFDDRLEEHFPGMKADFEWRKQNRCIPLFNKMKNIYAPVANEFIVYDQEHAICGTIDMIAYNMKTKQYAIVDWKTSKRFDTKSFTGSDFLNAPFNDIEVCNTAEYSLQLSLYKYMLKKKIDMPIAELLLFQIPGKDNRMPMVHRCMDLSERIQSFLENKT